MAWRRLIGMDVSAIVPTTFQIGGLPLHPLIVHAVVVLTPLTVLALLLGTFWPAARRRLGIVTPLAALLVLVMVPITVLAGRELKEIVGPLPAVLRHESFGNMLLPWVVALFVVSAGQWAWYRWGERRRARPAQLVPILIGIAAVVVGVGTLVIIVLIGDSGARAVWGPVVG
ncbi:DUF2231 domain-containing protein [Diaminobutyricimonas sp. LJ205]|uniref:DUF2231 domain-containing protein n=2 Tax=unclassified Diaminobutyricimonas TaxID=2643261 RepID=UPI001E3FC743|nr:DUF2231 domain-containing protein [Diaminobutyricimonas sp. LJ205]